MSLNTVTTGNTILAADINQLVYVLQRQSGQTETGKYQIVAQSYVTFSFFGIYIASLSRVSTPVSVTIDTADAAPPSGTGAPSSGNLTSNGFKIYDSAAQTNNTFFGGNTTIQF